MNREIKIKLLTMIPLVSEIIALLFLPSEIPIHYNMSFQVDGYGSKYSLIILGIIVVLFGLLMNWIYRKNENTAHETLIYRLCAGALFVFNVINLLVLCGSMFMGIDGTSIAVIDGADGPTAIFLAGSIGDGISIFLLLGIIVIFICAILLYLKKRRKNYNYEKRK